MEDIEVNDYVRTKNGQIIKVAWVGQAIVTDKEDKITISKMEIVKHSKEIIDLIEVGDLVEVFVEEYFENGEKIEDTYVYEVTATNVKDFKGNRLNEIGIAGECGPELIPFENVKGIATREAFKKVEYEV